MFGLCSFCLELIAVLGFVQLKLADQPFVLFVPVTACSDWYCLDLIGALLVCRRQCAGLFFASSSFRLSAVTVVLG